MGKSCPHTKVSLYSMRHICSFTRTQKATMNSSDSRDGNKKNLHIPVQVFIFNKTELNYFADSLLLPLRNSCSALGMSSGEPTGTQKSCVTTVIGCSAANKFKGWVT